MSFFEILAEMWRDMTWAGRALLFLPLSIVMVFTMLFLFVVTPVVIPFLWLLDYCETRNVLQQRVERLFWKE